MGIGPWIISYQSLGWYIYIKVMKYQKDLQ
jgi:hypothetical protein